MRWLITAGLILVLAGCGSSAPAKPKAIATVTAGATGTAAPAPAVTQSADPATAAERRLEAAIKRNPRDVKAYERLIGTRLDLSQVNGRFDPTSNTYTAAGKAELRAAAKAWAAYQRLNPPRDSGQARTANLMAIAFLALKDPRDELHAVEVFAEIHNSTGPYTQLAEVAYQQRDVELGDRAAQKAIALAPARERAQVKAAMKNLKKTGVGAKPVPVGP